MPKIVLVVLSKSDLDQRVEGRLISSKLHSYISEGSSMGLTFKFAFLPEDHIGLQRCEYSFLKLPYFASFWVLSFLSFLARIVGLSRLREWALERKSKVLLRSWSKLIELVRADGVIGIGLPQELINTARDLSILTIEVQHGSLDSSTFQSYWPRFKPSYFFCWNQRTAELSSEFGVDPVIVGHPILGELGQQVLSKTLSANLQSDQFSTFCVALTWGVQVSLDPYKAIHPGLAPVVDDLINRGMTPIFRLHPHFESRILTRYLLRRWVRKRWGVGEVQYPGHVSLVDSILASDFLVAHSSAAAYEFAIMNKPSVLLDLGALNRLRLELSHPFGLNFVFPSYRQLLRRYAIEPGSDKRIFLGSKRLVELMSAQ